VNKDVVAVSGPYLLPLYRKKRFNLYFGVAAIIWSSYSASHIELHTQLEDCYKISASQDRLACYDQLVKTIQATSKAKAIQAQPETVSIQSNQNVAAVPAVQEELGKKYLNAAKEHPASAKLELVKYYKDKQKRWVFEFGNNQIWRQIEPGYLKLPKHLPINVKIQSGVFGSYDLMIKDVTKKIKIKRLK
jgi:hypothetical protein